MDHIVETEQISGVSDGHKLGDNLVYTFLFSRVKGIIRDDIVHRLLAIKLRREDTEKFADACRQAQGIYARRIEEDPRQPELWAIEYLFQALQQHAHNIDSKTAREEIAQQFFARDIPEMLRLFTQVAYPLSLVEKRDLLIDILTPKPDEREYDWEFQFVVNYYLRDSEYNERPYQNLLRQIQDFFRKGEL